MSSSRQERQTGAGQRLDRTLPQGSQLQTAFARMQDEMTPSICLTERCVWPLDGTDRRFRG